VRQAIRIKFTDFWPTFAKQRGWQDKYFLNLLRTRFDLIDSEEPDVLMYSCFGSEHRKYNCFKIFYTGENCRPNFDECDFAFSFDHLDQENHYRLPLYALYLESPQVLVKKDLDAQRFTPQKPKFCNFVYSNGCATERIKFFERLSKYRKVDSAGRVLNNMGGFLGGTEDRKLNLLNEYKFTIAFENSSYPGYTTEKLIHPMLVESVPIYWGNNLVNLDFNTKSFLNYHDYGCEEEFIQRIIEVDRSDELYRQYLCEPYYHNNQVNSYIDQDRILDTFERIFSLIPG